MNLCPPVAKLHRQKSIYTRVRKTETTSLYHGTGRRRSAAGAHISRQIREVAKVAETLDDLQSRGLKKIGFINNELS
jgi:hypothetical protein